MAEKIAYYPGCTSKSYAKYMDSTSRDVLGHFGIDLVELSRWNCCGTFFGLAEDNLSSQLAPIRNMIRTREDGFSELTTTCSMCYNTLKRANLLVKRDAEKADRLNQFMYEEQDYEGDVTVLHLLEILRDKITIEKIASEVKQALRGLKIAPYYGCTLVRPKEAAIDDNPERPTILSDLIFALGGEAVESPYMTECCGSYLTVKDKALVADRTNKIIRSMAGRGANIILVSCPLCLFNLDRRQKEAKTMYPDLPEIPIVYFTQLMALALGMNPKKLGFKEHFIDPTPLLKELKLLKRSKKVPVKVKK